MISSSQYPGETRNVEKKISQPAMISEGVTAKPNVKFTSF